MHWKIARRYQRIHDGLLMKTSPIGAINQARFCMQMSEKISIAATAQNRILGRLLYYSLPEEVSKHVMSSPFDPYHLEMTQEEVFNWLWDHVVFDTEGLIIALIDQGDILANQHCWWDSLEWYARAKKYEWIQRDRENNNA